MEHGDAELAARAGAGDRVALEALYRRHVRRVWRYGWFRTHSREAAADIVQETFLRVARSVGGFEGRSSFATWLFAVARSVAVGQARSEQANRLPGTHQAVLRLIRAGDDRGDPLERTEANEAVRRAVAELPGAQRDAVVLCELSGLGIREAAQVLGWGESRVKVTLFRARRRLRDLLKDFVRDTAGGDEARSGGMEN